MKTPDILVQFAKLLQKELDAFCPEESMSRLFGNNMEYELKKVELDGNVLVLTVEKTIFGGRKEKFKTRTMRLKME